MIPSNMDGLSMGDELLEMHMDYQSPISAIVLQEVCKSMGTETDNAILSVAARYGIRVNKEKLVEALTYDRQQYRKGFSDGYRAAQDALVRCRDCEYWQHDYEDVGLCVVDVPDIDGVERQADNFCCYAERRGCKGKKAEADCFVCDQAACPEETGDARPYEEVGE